MEQEFNEDGTPKTPAKVELTTEQQDHVNKIINDRFAKIAEKHEKEKRDLEARLKREFEDAHKEHNTNPDLNPDGTPKIKPEDADKAQFKQLLDNEKNRANLAEQARQRAVEEAKQAKEESLNVRKTQAIYNAMGKQNFYQPEDVLNLTQSKIVFDTDSNTFVVKENGVIKQNSSLQNMSLAEYYAEVAASRPYLVNGDMKGGVNSRESSNSTSAGLIKSKADFKSNKEKSEFIDKFGFDKYQALPSK